MTAATSVSEATPTPDHVPESLVYDFDMFMDPGYRNDPHARILQMIDEAPPIFWTPRNGGHWMLIGHSANFEAARDTEAFSSEMIPFEQLQEVLASLPEGEERIPVAYPINLDPPRHGTYRLPLQRVFSPQHINTLKGNIREMAAEIIDEVVASGGCEFMSAVAEPLPVKVFLKMLGMPLDRMPEYRALVKAHLSEIQPDPANALKRLQAVAATMRPTLIERRDNPQDDIISMLWQTEIDGKPTTQEDLENYGVLLFIAGLDTVMQGMGHGIRHLAQNPELQNMLRENPERISETTEELLRRYTFTVPPRLVARDQEFQGVQMKAGERAMLFLPAADLDPREYENPEQVDLDRTGTHIAFNAGPHRCLGSHLARVELNILYEEWLARVPQFRVDPDHAPKFCGGHVVGVEELHLKWGA